MSSKNQMKAVVLHAPFQVSVQDVPVPQLLEPTDAIVKVEFTALCASDLHYYRGHQPVKEYDLVLGHEFIGTVTQVGSEVKQFQPGDQVLSPFTTSCGTCFYCERAESGRCTRGGKCFGTPVLAGAQAEYVRVELAETTLYHSLNDKAVPRQLQVLMADVVPTGYFVASNAYNLLNPIERSKHTTAVVVGCGPVGLCAVVAAKTFFTHVIAIDSVSDRLQEANNMGADETVQLSEDMNPAQALARVKEITEGRGADAALEVVGVPSALQTAISLVRPFGAVASCGIFTEAVTLHGPTLYGNNIRAQWGRCPVRSVFEVSGASVPVSVLLPFGPKPCFLPGLWIWSRELADILVIDLDCAPVYSLPSSFCKIMLAVLQRLLRRRFLLMRLQPTTTYSPSAKSVRSSSQTSKAALNVG